MVALGKPLYDVSVKLICLPGALAALFGAMLVLCAELAFAQTARPAAPAGALPTPTPMPMPMPMPNISVSGMASGYSFTTSNVNATGTLESASGDAKAARTDYSNLQITLARNRGVFRFGLTLGSYAFPTLGQSLKPALANGVNSDLYSDLPIAYVQFAPRGNWTFTAGKLASLFGQESPFTWQNTNVQRGLGFALEPTISRGGRAMYASGKFTGSLEYNDGYYAGNLNTIEGLLGWASSANTNVQFAWIIPPSNQRPNPTAGIANKREYDLMLTQQVGKLALSPYALWVNSPAITSLGFTKAQTAFAGVVIANYAFDSSWSLGGRYEWVANDSSAFDLSANSDLVGYGPGSKLATWTITSGYKSNHRYARGEYSYVLLNSYILGLGFGSAGRLNSQRRLGIELGVYFE